MNLNKQIIQGCKDVLEFYENCNLSLEHSIRPEYLSTVCIARAIASDKEYIIKLEESTRELLKASFVFILNSKWNKISTDLKRDGRFDIAIYSKELNTGYYPYKAICIVEVKNVNPAKHTFLIDIARLVEVLNLTDSKDNYSSILCAYQTSIEYKDGIFIEAADQWEKQIHDKYLSWLKSFSDNNNSFCYEVYLEYLTEPIYSKFDIFDDGDSASDAPNFHVALGVVVKILRNNHFTGRTSFL